MNNHRALASALARLDPRRITVGRELRGLTKKTLAERIGKTPSAISQFESGKSGLDLETFSALALALGLPPSFFIQDSDCLDVDFSTCHFRANRSVPQCDKRRAFRHVMAVVDIYRALERHGIAFPEPAIPTYTLDKFSPPALEKLAQEIRQEWNLGEGPILDMASFLESKGVLVVLLPVEFAKLDAFSIWAEDRPCIAITKSLAASRMQFDYAHELAHLVLHMEEAAGDPESERIANYFAGAFLAPARTFRLDCPRSWHYNVFLELKQYWRISIQASLFRARQLGLINESRYRWAMVDLSQRGERTQESGEFDQPLPTLLQQALELLKGELMLDELASEVRMSEAELEGYLRSQLVAPESIAAFKRPDPVTASPRVLKFKTSK